MDNLQLGPDEIFAVLGTEKPSDIHEFWRDWFDDDGISFGFSQEMWRIFFEYGINKDFSQPSLASNLRSPSHLLGVWSNNNVIVAQWDPAADNLSGVHGYTIAWDAISDSLPPEKEPSGG